DTPITTVAKTMLEQDIGAIPVGENDRLVGMVTDRDIAVRGLANGKDVSHLTARDIMTTGIVWCRDSDEVNQAAQMMESKQVRRLPVIDKNKRMVGILGLGDISSAASQRITAEITRAVSAHHARRPSAQANLQYWEGVRTLRVPSQQCSDCVEKRFTAIRYCASSLVTVSTIFRVAGSTSRILSSATLINLRSFNRPI